MSLFDSDHQASSRNLFQSEGDALAYLVTNGVGSPEAAEITVQTTDSDVLDSVLCLLTFFTSPNFLSNCSKGGPFSPISPAPLSDYFKVETPIPADYKDDDVFKSDNEQEEREQALLDQLHQLTSDTKPDIKPEFKPPMASEYIEQEEQMEVDNNPEDKKLKQEKIKEDEKEMKNM